LADIALAALPQSVERCLETIYSFLGIKFRTPKFNAQRGINLKHSWQPHKMAHISVSFAQIEKRRIALESAEKSGPDGI
jgi:hypothetical protein